MTTAELIKTLISGDTGEIIAIAAEAAAVIEAMEERIAIMGEIMTDMEYDATAEAAKERLENKRAAI